MGHQRNTVYIVRIVCESIADTIYRLKTTLFAIFCGAYFLSIIGHKILYSVFREKFLHLAVELSCKSLVVAHDKCRFVQGCDDIRHRKSLSGTSDSEQSLELVPVFKTVD